MTPFERAEEEAKVEKVIARTEELKRELREMRGIDHGDPDNSALIRVLIRR